MRSMVPPVLFHAEVEHGWPNLTVELAQNAQACFHADDKQMPKYLRWTLAKVQKLKVKNTNLQYKVEEARSLQDQHTMRLAEARRRADERIAAEKKLKELRRAEEEVAAQKKVEEQQRAEEEGASWKSLEEQQHHDAEKEAAARKKLEEQHVEEEAASQKRLEEQQRAEGKAAAHKELEKEQRAEEEAAAKKKMEDPSHAEDKEAHRVAWGSVDYQLEVTGPGHQLEGKSSEAAKVPKALVVDAPRGTSLQWTGTFVVAAATVREAMFHLQGI